MARRHRRIGPNLGVLGVLLAAAAVSHDAVADERPLPSRVAPADATASFRVAITIVEAPLALRADAGIDQWRRLDGRVEVLGDEIVTTRLDGTHIIFDVE